MRKIFWGLVIFIYIVIPKSAYSQNKKIFCLDTTEYKYFVIQEETALEKITGDRCKEWQKKYFSAPYRFGVVEISQEDSKQITEKIPETISDEKKVSEIAKSKNIFLIINKNIVNKDKLPNIKDNSIKILNVDNVSNYQFNEFKKTYSLIYVLIPKDFVVNSLITNKSNQRSEYVAGSSMVPNDRYVALQRTFNELQQAINMGINQIRYLETQSDCVTKPGQSQYPCAFANIGKGFEIGKLQNQVEDANRSLSRVRSELNSTPQYIKQDNYRSYDFVVETVEGKKEAFYDLISINNDKFEKATIKLDEKKIFYVANGISLEDRNLKEYDNKFSKRKEIEIWESTPIKSFSLNEIERIFNNSKKNNVNKRELNVALQTQEKNIFNSLFERQSTQQNKKDSPNIAQNDDQRFNSVVVVKTNSGLGTGFYVDNNRIITNYHVVDGASSISIENFKGEKSSAKIIKTDLQRDVALLETNLKGKPAKLFTKNLQIGIPVEAIGHPKGLKFTISKGIVSAVREMDSTYSFSKNKSTLFIQTDAAINSGNSGGPLFHGDYVIGINTQGLKKSETEGLNFAVHFDEIKKFLKN